MVSTLRLGNLSQRTPSRHPLTAPFIFMNPAIVVILMATAFPRTP